jgi:CubicO group peptidase (beta-lactamase class C family)
MNAPTLARFIAAPLLLLAAALVHAAPPGSEKFAGVDEKLKPFVAQNEIAGAVTLVASKDQVLHLSAVGEADLSTHAPMKTDALFWIASMTKPITGACVMIMQDEGKLNVDDQVSKYIPEFANLKKPGGQPANLTLKHLLTHTAGLEEVTPEQQSAAKTLADLLPHFANKPTKFEPGSKWVYSQTAINSLGRIVEIVSGQSFPDFLAKRLTIPLGMKDTTFYPNKEQQSRLAKSYTRTKDGKLEPTTIRIFVNTDLAATDRVPLANGGLFSTAADYGRFMQMVLAGGTFEGKTYLKPESVKLMTTVQSGEVKTGFTPGNGWGLGWIVLREPQGVTAMLSPGSAGHGGAYGTEAVIDFQKGLVMVLMVQRTNFPAPAGADGSEVRKVFQQAVVDATK